MLLFLFSYVRVWLSAMNHQWWSFYNFITILLILNGYNLFYPNTLKRQLCILNFNRFSPNNNDDVIPYTIYTWNFCWQIPFVLVTKLCVIPFSSVWLRIELIRCAIYKWNIDVDDCTGNSRPKKIINNWCNKIVILQCTFS